MSAAGRTLVVFLLCGLGFAQNPPAIPVPASPATGTISAGVYTNNFFKFSYRLPPQWASETPANTFQTRNDYRQETSIAGQKGGDKYLLVSAGDPRAVNSVQVVAYDTDGQPTITADDVAVAELGALRSLGGKMDGVEEKTIANRVFSVGRAEINGDVQGRTEPVYAGVAAVKEGNFVLTWSFFADSEAHLDQLLATLDTINFDK